MRIASGVWSARNILESILLEVWLMLRWRSGIDFPGEWKFTARGIIFNITVIDFAIWAILVDLSFYWREWQVDLDPLKIYWNFTVIGIVLIWRAWSVIHLIGKMNTALCCPTIPWKRIGKEFGGEGRIRSLRIFGKPLVINGFGMPLPTTFELD